MQTRLLYFIVVLFLSAFTSSCFTVPPTKTEKKTTSSIYNPFIYRLHPEYIVYCQSETKSLLYTKIYLSELMFTPMGPKKKYRSKLRIEYKIFPEDNLNQFIDSASAEFVVRKQKGQNNIISYIKLKDHLLNKYYLQITTTDLLRRTTAEKFIL